MSLCIGVMASLHSEKYINQVKGCLETWVPVQKETPVYFFCGKNQVELDNVPENVSFVHYNIEDDLASATHKQWYGFRHMLKKHPQTDHFLLIGSDNYVFVERTIECLSRYSPEQKALIGGYAQCRTLERQVLFPSGGGGMVLTRAALLHLEPLIEKYIYRWERRCRKYAAMHMLSACDVSLGDACWHADIPVVIERHFYLCSWREKLNSTARFPVKVDQDKICVHHYLEREEMLFYHRYQEHAKDFMRLEKKYARLVQETNFIFCNIYAGSRQEMVLYYMILNNMLKPTSRTLYIGKEDEQLSILGSKFDIQVKVYEEEKDKISLSVNDSNVKATLHVNIK
ncbi:putative Galactosyltransferase [Cedratvirus kamchatka]|uniref:Galactosyltransferase n=1 Tax=Cedratvirus kamchatka TaxID=2716914 RepID=A0A6G8MY59_9VIRU|nr:putative Galactosyltransferase [Cedratvirus kamchatka]